MLEELGRYVIATPMPFAVDLEMCEGMYLGTVDGDRLFDWAGYYGSKLIGHNHPRLYEEDYVRRLVRAANNKVANPDFLTQECLDYYRLLHRLAPVSMRDYPVEVYAINSGAEAVENMMKYLVAKFNAKKRARNQSVSGRRFLYFDQAFHGRNVYTLGVTQTRDPLVTRDFHGLTRDGNIKLPFPAINTAESEEWNQNRLDEALRYARLVLQQMADEVVAILVEPLQGAGGQRVASPLFFEGLSQLAREFDVYLAFDEVQTSLGPTGRTFAIDHWNLVEPPMAVAVGKKFGCGVLYMREPLEDIGILDSTWGGTLADMVRVVQEVKIVEDEGLIEAANAKGEQLQQGLQSIVHDFADLSFNVRGMGLYQGFSLRSPQLKSRLIEIAREEYGLLLLGAGAISIRTRPCLSVSSADIKQFLQLLHQTFTTLRSESLTTPIVAQE